MNSPRLLVALAVAVLFIVGVIGCVETRPLPDRTSPGKPVTSPPPAGWVDVEVHTGASAEIAIDGRFEVRDAAGQVVYTGDELPAGTRVLASSRGVRLGEARVGPAPVEIRPLGGATIQVGGRRYRGYVRIESQGRTVAVNRLPVEDYLRGVLPGEMPDGFGLQALKAQAVAARTYALSNMEAGRRLKADTRSQMYKGLDGETLVSSRAVKQTAGQVLEQRGRLIPAWYHSTCGGTTIAAAKVFPDVPPGVLNRTVVCPDCRASPMYSWTRRFDGADVCAAVGLPVAPLEEVIFNTDRLPQRPASVRVRAGGKEASLDALTFRSRLSAGKPLSGQMLSTYLARPALIDDGGLVVEGLGWGHGVGLCQYGAAGFASRGADYTAILERYYPDARLTHAR